MRGVFVWLTVWYVFVYLLYQTHLIQLSSLEVTTRPGLGMSFKGDIQIGQSRVVYRTGLKNTGLEVDYFELENGSRDQLKKTLTTIMFASLWWHQKFFSVDSIQGFD